MPVTSASAAVTAADDPAIAGLIGTATSQTRGALNALYPVYRVWDATANAYPARVAGAANIFIGPSDPGLAMDAVVDVWADPRNTTIDDVVAQLRAPGSEAWKAARSTQTEVSFSLDRRGAESSVHFGTSPNDVQALALDATNISSVQFSGRFPSDWEVATVSAYWLHDSGAGSARMEFAFRVLTSTGIANTYTTKQTYTSAGTMRANQVVFTSRNVAGGGLVNGWLTRLPGSLDTIAAPIGVLAVVAERVA
ncbi:MAG: hypothetical protein LBE05_05640 [Microbacterium sp.]|nr:hypothetical protein [Microbacterium sp.]